MPKKLGVSEKHSPLHLNWERSLQQAGDSRIYLAANAVATTLSIPTKGRFRLQLSRSINFAC
ncbi:hypothetical protein [Tychonema sp. LEGE 07203]|uniref:hypothetical protein n=1 Tax=Tychonema sp. LEGE 07203 TaxID=1828671 RepID=UPI001882D74B|nr:hypothetical protein [Tychonema sp. LEGE 07203]MBE9095349.1 hypothetical protein [Tychonema sp. LEGE 07203]